MFDILNKVKNSFTAAADKKVVVVKQYSDMNIYELNDILNVLFTELNEFDDAVTKRKTTTPNSELMFYIDEIIINGRPKYNITLSKYNEIIDKINEINKNIPNYKKKEYYTPNTTPNTTPNPSISNYKYLKYKTKYLKLINSSY